MFKNYFELEKYRETCALKNDDSNFLATYNNPKLPEIKNSNTEKEWETHLGDIAEVADPMTQDRIETTAKLIEDIQTIHTILDVGVGNGWVEKKLYERNKNTYEFHCLDITPKNLQKLAKDLPGTYYTGDILKLPKKLSALKFSCVLLLEVLEHISPRHTFSTLATIKKLLKKNGALIMSIPIYEDLEVKIQEKRNTSHHVRRYTPSIIKKELELSGFSIQKVHYFYAFSNMYTLKSLVSRITGFRRPNVMLIYATPSTR